MAWKTKFRFFFIILRKLVILCAFLALTAGAYWYYYKEQQKVYDKIGHEQFVKKLKPSRAAPLIQEMKREEGSRFGHHSVIYIFDPSDPLSRWYFDGVMMTLNDYHNRRNLDFFVIGVSDQPDNLAGLMAENDADGELYEDPIWMKPKEAEKFTKQLLYFDGQYPYLAYRSNMGAFEVFTRPIFRVEALRCMLERRMRSSY